MTRAIWPKGRPFATAPRRNRGPAGPLDAVLVLAIILVTSGALVLGAWIGVRGWLGAKGRGFLVALAGGALIVSVMNELISPALESLPLWAVAGIVLAGAGLFSLADAWTDRTITNAGGLGLVLAVTFDGVPENLALGTTLVSTGPMGAAALAGSILLSNLPEAAGGAASMREDGRSAASVMGLWAAVAALLALAAVAGRWLLADVPTGWTAGIESFTAGAVVASLSTEVFPKAGRIEPYAAGVAVAIGLTLALALEQLG